MKVLSAGTRGWPCGEEALCPGPCGQRRGCRLVTPSLPGQLLTSDDPAEKPVPVSQGCQHDQCASSTKPRTAAPAQFTPASRPPSTPDARVLTLIQRKPWASGQCRSRVDCRGRSASGAFPRQGHLEPELGVGRCGQPGSAEPHGRCLSSEGSRAASCRASWGLRVLESLGCLCGPGTRGSGSGRLPGDRRLEA